jgi:2-polyprenyl-3-methyl-5-hydroxy-6-metoxy-1,4-benzoquinol methylase
MHKLTEKPYSSETCNICGSSKWEKRFIFEQFTGRGSTYKDISVIKCLGCGVHRRMPAIEDDYEEDYHSPYVEQGFSIHPHQLSHFSDMSGAKRQHFGKSGLRFLDVGCSTGRALRLAKTMGFDVTGFDVSQWAVDYCRKGGFASQCSASLMGLFKEEDFDVVHCSHTIEHVPDPVVYLQEIHRVLKRGGILMLACPNFASIDRIIYGKKWGIWCLDSHLWQFSRKQMVKLIKHGGFDIFRARTLHGRNSDKQWKWIFWDAMASLGYSDGLNIVARKRD